MEWISIEDRLPEKHQDVLVFQDNYGGIMFQSHYTRIKDTDIPTWWWADDGEYMGHPSYITHWMPLPNKPI